MSRLSALKRKRGTRTPPREEKPREKLIKHPSEWFEVQGKIPSKKNRYRIGVSPKLQKVLTHYPKGVSIILGADAKEAQLLIAWTAKRYIPAVFPADARLRLDIQLGLANDVDGVLTTVMDALELSGRVPNDKQIEEVHVTRKRIGKKTRIRVTQLV